MPIPAGARSVVVDFQCTGGAWFHAELGDTMMLGLAPYRGTCDGPKKLAWPITGRTQGEFHVTIPANTSWTAVAHFSSAPFPRDTAVTADCKAFSGILSELANADNGYASKAFGAAEWSTRIEEASKDLAAAVTASHSRLKDTLTALEPTLDASTRLPGTAQSVMQPAADEINDACTSNQTPVIVSSEFGG